MHSGLGHLGLGGLGGGLGGGGSLSRCLLGLFLLSDDDRLLVLLLLRVGGFGGIGIGLELFSLLATLLELRVELVIVFLEVNRSLHDDLEAKIRSSLDPDHADVAPSRQNIHNLSQLGHPLGPKALKDQRLMLIQVENVLDDAHVLVCGQTHANRQQVGEVFLAVLSTSLGSSLPLLARACSLPVVASSYSFTSSAILAVGVGVPAPRRVPASGLLLLLWLAGARCRLVDVVGLLLLGGFTSGWCLLLLLRGLRWRRGLVVRAGHLRLGGHC